MLREFERLAGFHPDTKFLPGFGKLVSSVHALRMKNKHLIMARERAAAESSEEAKKSGYTLS